MHNIHKCNYEENVHQNRTVELFGSKINMSKNGFKHPSKLIFIGNNIVQNFWYELIDSDKVV